MTTLDEIYDADAEQEALLVIVERRYLSLLKAIHHVVADALGLDPIEAFRLRDEDTEALLKVAAEQVVRIDSTTRAALQERLAEGARLGLSGWEIANGSPQDGFAGIDALFTETWRGRADTVARNELLNAQYLSSLDRYKASGLVDHVRAHDGDQDELCSPRNGRTYPIDQAPERAHVNCSLVLVPIVREASA